MKKEKFPRKQGEWTELSRETVYSNPWIEVNHSEVLNPNGGRGIYGVVHFKNLAIGIIALDDQGYIYMVGQERFPFQGKFTWEIIQGGGPLDTDPLESARRELLEEAGLKASRWQLIQEMDLSNSATDEKALIYVARGLSAHQQQPDETEKLQIKKVPLEKVVEEVLKGQIVDSLTVAGILRVKYL